MTAPSPGTQEWLDHVVEDVIDPHRPIVDPHHHFWPLGETRFVAGEASRDPEHHIAGNFPVDRFSLSYRTVWNAFKKLSADFSHDEQAAMFRGTATRIYSL